MKEEWRPVLGFEETHEVSNFGNVRSKERKIPYTRIDNGREVQYFRTIKSHVYEPIHEYDYYFIVRFYQNNKTCAKFVHRLVAEAFVPNDNPENKIFVDHIDGDRYNNHADNLIWVTPKDCAVNRKHKRPKVPCICIDDGHTFSSVSEAGRYYHLNPTTIYSRAKNGLKTHGLTFQFLSGEEFQDK